MSIDILTIYGLGVAAVGCVLFIALPYLSGDIKAEKRKEALQVSRPKRGGERTVDAANRRKQISESLKDVEKRGKTKRRSIESKIEQAGLTWTRNGYFGFSAAASLVLGIVLYVADGNLLYAAVAALVGAVGVPSWVLSFLAKRRMAKFVAEFPNAVDVIIRGVKAGLPIGDCLRMIASDATEPLRSEFRRVVEAQAVGLTITEAVERMAERVPVTETNFFSIVIGIQQKAGGNLTEALTNLSRVIRERKKMKMKIKAVSSEAKTSAYIIGALPFVVSFFVYVTSPKYMELLWNTDTGLTAMGCCALWMAIGVFVMRKDGQFRDLRRRSCSAWSLKSLEIRRSWSGC